MITIFINFLLKDRIDKYIHMYLSKHMSISRTIVQKLIKDGYIIDNNNKTIFKKKCFSYKILFVKFENIKKLKEFINKSYLMNEILSYKSELEILYEDDYIIAINKQCNISVQPNNIDKQKSIINIVKYYLQNKNIFTEPKLINRIDREVSGIVLICKNALFLNYFQQQFIKKTVQKIYLAVVDGKPDKNMDIIENKIKFKFNRQSINDIGKISTTHYKLIEYNSKLNISLLLLKPITGRQHQLRFHMKYIGCPILGDEKYGNKKTHSRIMLHSYQIFIKSFTGENLNIISTIPEEFKNNFKINKNELF